MTKKLKVLQLEGDNYQIGYQHGKALAKEIELVIQIRYKQLKYNLNISFKEALQESLKYYSNAEKYFPEYIKEIEGIADGAQIPFEKVFFIQVASELAFRPLVECSAFAITPKYVKDGKVFIGQNLDTLPDLKKFYSILHIKPIGKPEILMFSYAGIFGYIALNKLGLAHVFNTLKGPGWKYGITHYFIHRKLHEMKSVKECAEFIKELPIASSGNYLISDNEGKIMDLEVTHEGVREIYSDKILVHTNHFLHEDFIDHENFYTELDSSKFRLNRLTSLINNKLPISLEEIMSIMGDHENFPESICRHQKNVPPFIETTAALIFNPQEGKMFVALGTPCNTSYQCFNIES